MPQCFEANVLPFECKNASIYAFTFENFGLFIQMVVLVNAIIAPKRKRKISQYNLDVLFVLVLSNSRSEVEYMGMLEHFQVEPFISQKPQILGLYPPLPPVKLLVAASTFWHCLPHHRYFHHLSNQVGEKGVQSSHLGIGDQDHKYDERLQSS